MKNKIAEEFSSQDSERQPILERARQCAALTRPWILPQVGQSQTNKMPEVFTSLPGRGIANLEGRLLMSLYPVGTPFFRLVPAARIRYNKSQDPAQVQAFSQALSLYELLAMAKLESADVGSAENRRRGGFRSRKRQAITQILVTGDCLEQLTDDYRVRVFRRDQYTTVRDSSQEVISHIIKEKVDPLSLPIEIITNFLSDEVSMAMDKPHSSRTVDMYTRCKWQPQSRVWIIEQQINGKTIQISEEPVSPFICTPYELVPGEHYGRGFVESNLGDIRSLNELHERLLDFAGMASKFVPCIDYNSQVVSRDLAKPSGEVIQARVLGGQVQDIAFLSVNKSQDFQVVYQTAMSKRQDLATAMLMESESAPKGDRVTAFQISRVAAELEGALGGVYAPIADSQQVPLVERLMWQMSRDSLMPKLPGGSIEIEALTGLAALSRENDKQKILQLVSTMTQFGPEAANRINIGVLFDTLLRQSGIYEPGLIKTDEQLSAEATASMQQQQEMMAQEQMVKTSSNVMESSLTKQGGQVGSGQ